MKKTTNYNLNQWDATDRVKRADFNADNAAVDAALKANADSLSSLNSAVSSLGSTVSGLSSAVSALSGGTAKLAMGTYVGNGKYGAANPNTITFDFEPKFLIVQRQISAVLTTTSNNYLHLNTLIAMRPLQYYYFTGSINACAELTWNGKSVSWFNTNSDLWQLNKQDVVFNYLALG